ncbi:MAG: endonuclease domain-containing protein [Phocaeicola sp.]
MEEDMILNKAKKLRKSMTKQERHLWYDFLRNRPEKWYKQKIIGNYIVDFYCEAFKLVIELDGSQHYEEKAREYDKHRSEFLESMGNKVIRFTNTDVDSRFDSVCESIVLALTEKRGDFLAKGY